MIEDVRIDSDERGFELVLAGDFTEAFDDYLNADDGEVRLRLPQDAVIRLAAVVRTELGPWLNEMERELAAYSRASPSERAEVLHLVPDDEGLDTSDPKHPRHAELLAERADHHRKQRKEA